MKRSASSADVARRVMTSRTTKKTRASGPKRVPHKDLAREYRFDYGKSKANRFAKRVPQDAVVVVLDSDVAKVFRDSKRVNALLRASIAAGQKRRPRRAS
jgi:uncharacterized protein (DUF4415 family)